MSLSLRPNANVNNGLSPGVRDMEAEQTDDSTSVLVLVGLSDEKDSSCQDLRRTQVLEPADSLGQNGTPTTMGKLWYEPDCGDCCHPPSDPALSLLQLTTVLIQDEKVVNNLKVALKQGTLGEQEQQLEKVFAHIQAKPSLVHIQREDVSSLVRRGPSEVKVSSKTRLDFEARFDFRIPKKVSNLVAISFLSINREKALQSYGLELSHRESVQSLINVTFVYENNQKVLHKETRYLDAEKCFLEMPITKIKTSLYESQKPRSTTIANRFWISRATSKINTVFFGFDRREMIKSRCLIPFLADLSIYDGAILEQISVKKRKFYGDKEENLLITTREIAPGRILDATSRDDFNGESLVMSSIRQMPLSRKTYKIARIDDYTDSQGKFRYSVTFSFVDPTIGYLRDLVYSMGNLLTECREYYDFVYQRNDSKKEQDISFSSPMDVKGIQSIGTLIDTYYREIVNFGGERCAPKKYMTFLANPASDSKRHEAFLQIVGSFYGVLKDFFISFGANKSGTGRISSNSYSSAQKQKGILEVGFLSKILSRPKDNGVDFISKLDDSGSTVQRGDSIEPKVDFSQEQIEDRGVIELGKFWSVPPTEEGLVENAKFFLTPNLFIDGDNTINFTSIEQYDDDFFKKINAIPSALSGKLEQTRMGVVDTADSSILIEFEELLDDGYMQSSEYLPGNDNFISDNIVSYKEQETVTAEQEVLKVFGTYAQGTFQQNFDSPDAASKEQLAKRAIDSLPPPYQSYVLRNDGGSKFSGDPRFDDLQSAENTSIVQNLMNMVARLQYLDLSSGLQAAEWKDLTTQVIQETKNLLVRVNLFSDEGIRITEKQGVQVYKQYFTISDNTTGIPVLIDTPEQSGSDTLKEINNVILETQDGRTEVGQQATFGAARL